jgi:hypothetical protein
MYLFPKDIGPSEQTNPTPSQFSQERSLMKTQGVQQPKEQSGKNILLGIILFVVGTFLLLWVISIAIGK